MFRKKLIYSNIIMALGFGLSCNSAYAWNANCVASGDTNNCTGTYSVWSQARLDYDNVNITNSGKWNISGPQGVGIYVSAALVAQGNLTILMTGSGYSGNAADAIRTQGSGSINILNGKLYIETNGWSADGINATVNAAGSVNIGDDAEIYINNTTIAGVGVRSNLSNSTTIDNVITIGENLTVATKGAGNNASDSRGYAVYAGNRNSEVDAAIPVGGAQVILGDNSTLSTLGNNAHVVYANKTGVIQVGNTTITAAGTGAYGLYTEDGSIAKSGHPTQYFEGGKIHLLGNANITVKDGSYAAYSKGLNSVISSTDANGAATSGKFTVTGNMKSETGGLIDLNMTNGSLFIGNTTVVDGNSTLNLAIDGANSIWKMDTDSDLTTLNLTNGANVYLSHHTTAVNDTDGNITLTIGNLSGNGVFHLRSDIAGTDCSTGTSFGDFIRVTGTSSGSHKVFVNDNYTGGAAVDGTERLKIIETADGVAEFELSNASGQVDLGAYKYELVRGDNLRTVHENWWLQAAPVVNPPDPGPNPPDPGPGPGPTPPDPGPTPPKTDPADNSGNILNINYLLSNVENQTLLQRMGEIRRNRHTEGDVWIRTFTGKLDSFADSTFHGFDMNYDGIQIGADKYIAKDFYIGMMMGTSKADVDYEVGSGKTKSHNLGLYGTYKSENGWYVDAIAKVNRIKNNFDTKTSGGYVVEGYGNANGLSVGVEAGKRFYKDESLAGLYLEPQVQYTYSHQGSSKVKASNGLRTELHSFDSHIGRASVIFGYTALKGDTPVDVYLKTGYVREFDGKTGVTFNGKAHEEYKFNGNWWDNGIGASVQVKQRHNFYLEADYSKGNKFDKKQVNVGYRYAF